MRQSLLSSKFSRGLIRTLSTSTFAVPNVNYASHVLAAVEREASQAASKAAMIDGSTGATTTYGDYAYRVGAAARGFRAAGVTRGSVVAIHLPNSPEFVIAFTALASLGATVTTSNPLYSPTELAHQFKDSGASFILTCPPLKPSVEAASKAIGLSPHAMLVLGEPSASFLTIDVSAASSARRALPEIASVDAANDVLVLPYSSGTTGLPKGVALTHTNLAANIVQTCGVGSSSGMGLLRSDVLLGVLPLYHIYGITVVMGVPLASGATVVTLPKFDPGQFLGTLVKYKASYLPLVPPIIAFLAKHPSVAGVDLSSVRCIFSGAAPLDADSQTACEKRLPKAHVRQGYGMTESSPVTHVAPMDEANRPGSIGRPVVATECRVVDPETGATLPAGRANVGELQVRGPQVMKGYHNNAAATAATIIAGGWLRTGDLVYRDADDFYFVVDRLKELIKSKGFQVAPAELEGIIMGHPLIYDAAVVPRADERAGEVPVAFVVTKAALLTAMGNAAGASALPPVTAADVQAFVASKVAEYKRLAAVYFVDTIPKNPSGKILRRVLRAKVAEMDKAPAK